MLHHKLESRWVKKGKKPPFPLGTYLIYSTKKAYSIEEFRHLSGNHFNAARNIITKEPTSHLNGHAICLGDLTDIIPMTSILEASAFIDTDMTQWETNGQIQIDDRLLWGLGFKNIRRIKPFPFKGKQGVGILSEIDKAKIDFA